MPHYRFFVFLAIVLPFLLWPTRTVRADDGYVAGVGGAVEMLQPHPTIRMVSEEVRIWNPEQATVRATFVFHNDGPATDVLMGFPEKAEGVDTRPRSARLTDFRSWVDGKPAAVVRRGPPFKKESELYADWLVKRVHFRAHQTRVVVDTYRGGGGRDSSGSCWFTYVLKTGASWNGPIGHARIICDLGTLSHYGPVTASPDGCRRRRDRFIWDFRNLKPDDDVEIRWFPAFLNVRVDGQYALGIRPGEPPTAGNLSYSNLVPYTAAPPIRRGDDIWLPGKMAAEWLGAKFAIEEPAKRIRLTRGGVWADVTVGSRIVRLSNGKTLTMPWPSTYQRNRGGPWRPYAMVSLRTLVTAFGGQMTYVLKDNRVDVRMPKS